MNLDLVVSGCTCCAGTSARDPAACGKRVQRSPVVVVVVALVLLALLVLLVFLLLCRLVFRCVRPVVLRACVCVCVCELFLRKHSVRAASCDLWPPHTRHRVLSRLSGPGPAREPKARARS